MGEGDNHWAQWQQVALESFSLWMEAGQVIWLRSAKLAAGGPAANVEAVRMVEEKLEASWQLAGRLFGASPLDSPQFAPQHRPPLSRQGGRKPASPVALTDRFRRFTSGGFCLCSAL